MIVKNEAEVIRRCLDSVLGLIDTWLVLDTGSTDETQEVIRDHLHAIPGVLQSKPWRDFGHNRSQALLLARGMADYTLIMDADDSLEIEAGFKMPDLSASAYSLDIINGGTRFSRPQLISNALPWRYEGVLHEYLTCSDPHDHAHLAGLRIRQNHDGARRKDPDTYRRDALVLEDALRLATDPFLISRYRFYLAQSYRDAGDPAKALENYRLRAELGFWPEEVFISLYQAAQLMETLQHSQRAVIDTYLRATTAFPSRAEALHGASRFCRLKGRHEEGFQLAKRGLAISRPADGLFMEDWIYAFGLLDELAVNGYWSGHHHESLQASLKLLSDPDCPPEYRARFAANAFCSLEKLRQATD
ncbi:glycosyltransferase [Acidisoma sp.]|uniref:glycosyltransferase n=1 Tax=Acidisoma sp. TaxID=1872115 RepID=UPI003AFF6CCC